MPELNPEQQARQRIDAMLIAAGWAVQDYTRYQPGAALGVALREVPVQGGRCDYLLLVSRKPVGVIEARKEGLTLSTVTEQSAFYGMDLPDFLQCDTGKRNQSGRLDRVKAAVATNGRKGQLAPDKKH